MKRLQYILSKRVVLLCCFILPLMANAQDEEKAEITIDLQYFSQQNQKQYLVVTARTKVDKRFQPAQGINVSVYMDSVHEENLLASSTTDEKGISKYVLPLSLTEKWNASSSHKFIALSPATKETEELTSEITIAKARMSIDTLTEDGIRSVKVNIQQLNGSEWEPVKDADVKVSVLRLGGELPVSDEETYLTDSLGEALAEYKRDSLPGDSTGMITLVARIENNDAVGNLMFQKKVDWGVYYPYHSNFEKRTLWATRDKTPFWLLAMAYAIIAIVWGTIIYLIYLLSRVISAGKKPQDAPSSFVVVSK